MMNVNPLFLILKQSKIPGYRLAEKINMSKNTITRLTAYDAMPRNVEVETLDKLVRPLGYRVIVSFEPIEGADNGTN